jgi:hypothetical protein
MKIVLQKSTGEILSAFSGIEPDDATLLDNHSDIDSSDLEIKTVDSAEHAEISLAYLKTSSDGYKQIRSPKYPALAEQLDLLYHDMAADKGTKAGEWFKAVKKVKDDNPKP